MNAPRHQEKARTEHENNARDAKARAAVQGKKQGEGSPESQETDLANTETPGHPCGAPNQRPMGDAEGDGTLGSPAACGLVGAVVRGVDAFG